MTVSKTGAQRAFRAHRKSGYPACKKVIPGSEAIDTGVFECTPGTYRRSVKQAEVMHFLAGNGRFTPDGEDTIHFTGGDTLFFAANTEGTWEVDETMRKVYVIF